MLLINWNVHIASSAHLENIKKVAAIPSKMLLSFFNKKATSLPLEAPHNLSTLSPFHLSSLLMPGVSVTLPPTPIPLLSLLDQLKVVINSFPVDVPYGVDSDDLAIFAESPHAHIQQDDEAWESLDPLLNQVIGYSATPKIISQCI